MIRNIWSVAVLVGGLLAPIGFVAHVAHAQHQADLVHHPYRLDIGLVSRTISFENPTGGRSIWLPMPFVRRAKMPFTNEGQFHVLEHFDMILCG